MDIKKYASRIALSGLVIGSLAAAAFWPSVPAFAEPPDAGDGPSFTWLPPNTTNNPSSSWVASVTPSNNQTTTAAPTAPTYVFPVNPYWFYWYGTNPIYPVYPVYPTYPIYPYTYSGVQVRGIFIAAAARALGTTPDVVSIELSQGKTLTQIAGERGWPRSYFLSLLVRQVQADVIDDINTGAIDPATGNWLLSNLYNQASLMVDQPGL